MPGGSSRPTADVGERQKRAKRRQSEASRESGTIGVAFEFIFLAYFRGNLVLSPMALNSLISSSQFHKPGVCMEGARIRMLSAKLG